MGLSEVNEKSSTIMQLEKEYVLKHAGISMGEERSSEKKWKKLYKFKNNYC